MRFIPPPVKRALKHTPFYALYQNHILPRRLARAFWNWSPEDEARLNFYRHFVRSGCTVFDVGANMGNRTKVFLKLGAHVCAVEPQPKCAEYLAMVLKGNPHFTLIRKALGREQGEAEMLISQTHTISSLSTDWIEATRESGRFAQFEWQDKELVEVDTLDNLIDIYGRPGFIKIDVEGYEAHVLSGLSTPVDLISIEFIPEYMQDTFKCIDHVGALARTEFQISLGESMEFHLARWVSKSEIKDVLSRVEPTIFGDIYMRMSS